jgi:hypothetical protein
MTREVSGTDLPSPEGTDQASPAEIDQAGPDPTDQPSAAATDRTTPAVASGLAPTAASRLAPIARTVILDIAAPLVAYGLLRSAGLSTVTALVLSGVFPASGVIVAGVRRRRIEVVGALVLAGIIVGTVLGLLSHNARLVLAEGSVPTGVFGVACLGSLRARRPLMFRFALEFIGPDTAKGREMTALWSIEGYRRVFRVITAVWGSGFLLEAAVRVVIAVNVSTGLALAASKVMPFLWAGVLSAWTVGYGSQQKKKGERQAASEIKALTSQSARPLAADDSTQIRPAE